MKRRRLKASPMNKQVSRETQVTVHDRQATELPRGAIVAPVLVQDVYEPEKRQVAILSLRDDPLGALWARHQIDDAKYIAGRRWQQYYETAAIGALKGMDTSKEPVDGGQISIEFLTEARLRAVVQLHDCAKALGRDGDGLVRDVLGQGMFILQAAAIRNQSAIYVGARFRECLECLAREFGYA